MPWKVLFALTLTIAAHVPARLQPEHAPVAHSNASEVPLNERTATGLSPQDENPVGVAGAVAPHGGVRVVRRRRGPGLGGAVHRIQPRRRVTGLHLRLVDGDAER